MYLVVGYDLKTHRRIVYAEVINSAEAYELAHEFDAANKLGRDNEETDKLEHPCSITIEDELGNDVWQECARARCPSAIGLFQNSPSIDVG